MCRVSRALYPIFVALALASASTAIAQSAAPSSVAAQAREQLNSERIEARFGSYGVEVLEPGPPVRVSSLYSTQDGVHVCRTFAVVRYPDRIDAALAAEHEEIVHGGSIGAVFARHGFRVRKTHLYFGVTAATPRLAALMHVPVGAKLALDAYVLDVAKSGATYEYAALVEIHHPDYLSQADLAAVYGPADAAGREALLRELLAASSAAASR